MSSLRTAFSLADARLRALGGLSAALRLAERLALVVAAYSFVLTSRRDALIYALALAALFATRAALTAAARSRALEALHAASLRAVLRGDVLSGSVLADEDAQTVVFEGVHHGGRVVYELTPDLVGDALAAVIFAIYLVVTKPPRLLAVGALVMLFAAAGVLVARRVTARAADRARREYRPVIEDLIAGIGARLELVASGREEAFVARYNDRLRAWRRVAARSEGLSALAGRAPIAAAALAVGLALVLDQSLRGTLTSAALADAAVFASVVPAFTGLARSAHELVKSNAKLAPLAHLIATPAASASPRPTLAPPSLPAPIAWRAVSFAYALPDGSRGPLALDRVTLDWSPGSVLVLEGANGSGKSTCLRLLLALARPLSGAITIGDRDLFTLDLHAWRRSIAYLPQRPYMPDRGTVRDAIRLVVPGATDVAMRAALERVGLWSALAQSRAGSALDVLTATLSAGQRQRVALARVLVQDAHIFLLDEPDANLDHDGIAIVARVVRELAASRMVAVAAHTDAIASAGDHRVKLGA